MKKLREDGKRDIVLIKEWKTKAGLKAFITQWIWKMTGFLPNHYCGYVEKPDGDITEYYQSDLDIHGGITFEGEYSKLSDKILVGFDMAHYGDEEIPNPKEYAEQECEKLAELLTKDKQK